MKINKLTKEQRERIEKYEIGRDLLIQFEDLEIFLSKLICKNCGCNKFIINGDWIDCLSCGRYSILKFKNNMVDIEDIIKQFKQEIKRTIKRIEYFIADYRWFYTEYESKHAKKEFERLKQELEDYKLMERLE